MDHSAGYEIPREVLSRELDGETILLDLQSHHYFGLNRTGSVAWRLLGEGRGRDEIVSELVLGFKVEEQRARDDVESFLADVLERGLLRVRLATGA